MLTAQVPRAGELPELPAPPWGDLSSDLGVTDEDRLLWARGRVVVAARAAELPAPAMSVYTSAMTRTGSLRRAAEAARSGSSVVPRSTRDSCRSGQFVDRAMVEGAERVIALAARRADRP